MRHDVRWLFAKRADEGEGSMTAESDHALVKELITSMPEFKSDGTDLSDEDFMVKPRPGFD